MVFGYYFPPYTILLLPYKIICISVHMSSKKKIDFHLYTDFALLRLYYIQHNIYLYRFGFIV